MFQPIMVTARLYHISDTPRPRSDGARCPPAGRPALSHLWEHYCSVVAVPSVQEHVRALVQAELLTLPWDRLAPQLHDAERFAQLLDVYLPEAHSFAAQVREGWRQRGEACSYGDFRRIGRGGGGGGGGE